MGHPPDQGDWLVMTADEQMTLFGEQARDAHEFDVWLMARRMALLYHYLAGAIVDRLGEAEGYALVKDAVWRYGEHCGGAVRDQVLAKGLPLTAENFRTIPDLPARGWRSEVVEANDGDKENRATLCPLARTWAEIGTPASLARLYCFVDQSKIAGYNDAALECVHEHNVLDGDGYCEIVIRPKSAGE